MISEVKLGLVQDLIVREALTNIYESLRENPLLRSEFRHVELTFDESVNNFKFYHGFGFRPTHVLTAFVTNEAAVIWNLDDSTDQYIILTTSDSCTVRAFIGRYEEGERV